MPTLAFLATTAPAGLYTSPDDGITWTLNPGSNIDSLINARTSDGLHAFADGTWGCIGAEPGPNVVYLHSLDGTTWIRRSVINAGAGISTSHCCFFNSDVILYYDDGLPNGVVFSTNRGLSWSPSTRAANVGTKGFVRIPSTGRLVLYENGGSVAISDNNGASWTNQAGPIPNFNPAGHANLLQRIPNAYLILAQLDSAAGGTPNTVRSLGVDGTGNTYVVQIAVGVLTVKAVSRPIYEQPDQNISYVLMDNGGQSAVFFYNGTTWASLGNFATLPLGTVMRVWLTPNGNLLARADGNNNLFRSIDGTAWTNVTGGLGLTTEPVGLAQVA